jgi:hypothetical protein
LFLAPNRHEKPRNWHVNYDAKNQEVIDLYTEFCISFFGGLFLGFAISAELITLISIPSRASG